MNVWERERNVSSPLILARLKRDWKSVERLLERGDYAALRKAWGTSGRISARLEILRDRAGGRDHPPLYPYDGYEVLSGHV